MSIEIKVPALGESVSEASIAKLHVKAGDSVLYGKYSGTEMKFDGKDYLILKESDIFAII